MVLAFFLLCGLVASAIGDACEASNGEHGGCSDCDGTEAASLCTACTDPGHALAVDKLTCVEPAEGSDCPHFKTVDTVKQCIADTTCPDGTAPGTGLECVDCAENCAKCSAANTCTECEGTHALDAGACKVPGTDSGCEHYRIPDGGVKTCVAGDCDEGETLGGSDNLQCIEGNTPTPEECADVENCATCPEGTCTKCKDTFALKADKTCVTPGDGVEGCPYFQEIDKIDTCVEECPEDAPLVEGTRECKKVAAAGDCSVISGYPAPNCAGPFFAAACYGFVGCDVCGVDLDSHEAVCLHCVYGTLEDGKCKTGMSCGENLPNCQTGQCEEDDPFTCKTCKDGFSGATCQPAAIAKCKVPGDDGKCLFCDTGAYLDSDGSCKDVTTTVSNCLHYSDADTCAVCSVGFYLADAGKNCTALPTETSGCLVGTDKAKCQQCSGDATTQTCDLCPAGMGFGDNGCEACANGAECVNADDEQMAPTKCSENYHPVADLEEGTISCERETLNCPAHCADTEVCTDGKCEICRRGYRKDTEKGTCVACPENCAVCTDTVCSECADGFKPDGNSCVRCPDNCNKCSADATKCDADSCKARDETGRGFYFKADDGSCPACPEGCAECENGDTCLTGRCASGYYEVEETTEGATVISCKPCSALSNCMLCEGPENEPVTPPGPDNPDPENPDTPGGDNTDDTTTYRLREGEDPTAPEATCTACLPGFYNDPTNGCTACSVANATCPLLSLTPCTEDAQCTHCMPGFFKNGSICSPCAEGCATCGDDGTCPCTGEYVDAYVFNKTSRQVEKNNTCEKKSTHYKGCGSVVRVLTMNSYGIPDGFIYGCRNCEDGSSVAKSTKDDGITYFTAKCSGGSGGGMDPKTRNIIIGCVVAAVVVIVVAVLGGVFGAKACKAKKASSGSNEQALQPISSDVASN